MTQAIDTATAAVAEVVRGIAGVGAAPANPLETMNERVFALTYPMVGDVPIGPVGTRQELWDISVDLITPFDTQAITSLLPILVLVVTAFDAQATYAGTMFSGSIDTFENIHVDFLPIYPYAAVDCIAYRVILQRVKLMVNL